MKHLIKSAAVKRISPGDGHYFFGYYDLQPYNESETLYLTHKSIFDNRLQRKGDTAEVGILNMSTGKYEKLDITHAWNFQQGAMLQWNPLAAEHEIIYNDLVDGFYCGVLMDILSGKKRYLERPVANVSRDGKYALSINMSRLYDFRPGYGYADLADPFYDKKHCSEDGVFLIDMNSGKAQLILSMEQIWEFSGSYFKEDEKMVINHITFNTDASRFLMLVRNFPKPGERHRTALITANRDGSDMYLLSDYGMQSHYWWLNEKEVIFFADGKELACRKGEANNYILKDKSYDGYILADGYFSEDNHMSFSPNQRFMITDSYPDLNRHQALRLYSPEKNVCVDLGYFYSMPRDCIDIRCDLHPRWNRNGNVVTFDSTHEGFRGIYKIELPEELAKELLEGVGNYGNI